MKKILSALVFTAALFCCLSLFSPSAAAYVHYEAIDDFDDCCIYYDADFENATATVTDFYPCDGKVIIPEKVEPYYEDEYAELSVVKIKNGYSYEDFEFISVPKSVTEIEQYAIGYICQYDYDSYYDDTYIYNKIDGFTIGCVGGSCAEAYALQNGFNISYIKDISELSVSLSDTSFTYDFENDIKPAVTVLDGDKVLTEDTDYTLRYENNYSVGTATVTVTCKGNYTGSKTLSYTINPVDVSMLTFSEVEDREFDGSAYEPYISVTYGDEYLYEGDDYTVTYENNRMPGTASATFVFKGVFTGSKTITFKIYIPEIKNLTAIAESDKSISLSWECDSWNIDSYYIYRYNAKKKKYVKISSVSYSSFYEEKLKADTNYKYKIVPVVKDGKDEVKGTAAFVECRTLIKAPKIELTVLKDSIKIKYTKVSGAKGYVIYRIRCDKFSEEEKIKTLKGGKAGTYTDKTINSNGIYCYYLRAYKTENGKTVYGANSSFCYTNNADAILRGATLRPKTSFPVYNTQGATTTSYTYYLSDNDMKIVKAFAKKHFKKKWTDAEKLMYTLNWINTKVLYARGENWNKIAGKTWVDAIYTYKMGQCAQYNGAMAAMLVYLGYDASIIKGYRGSGTQHFWCEVKIQGRTYVMETGNYSSSGTWSYFLEPYSNTFGYVKNGKSVTTALLEPDAESITLSKTKYVYNGKSKKPSVKVVNTNGKTLKEGKDYTVEYDKGRKNYGNYKVTVTLKGKYAGKEVLYFEIIPKTPSFKLTAGKKSFSVSLEKAKNVTAYEVVYSTDKSFPWDKTDYYTAYEDEDKIKINGLKKNKKYYVKVRTVVEQGDNFYYSDYAKVKSIKTK